MPESQEGARAGPDTERPDMTQLLLPSAIETATLLAWVAGALLLAGITGVALALTTDDREPSIVLAWLLVILLVPVLGLVAYFFLGRNHRRAGRKRRQMRARMRDLARHRLSPTVDANAAFTAAATRALAGTPAAKIEATARHEGGVPVLPAEDVRVYTAGEDKFRDLLADMGRARRSIDLMYLIWEQDELTAEVTAILLERLSAGVRVHILYDWLSSLQFGKKELARLSDAGAVVAPCYKKPSQLNYRNHMKIAVVDDSIVFTGGMNMGQEYVDGGRRFPAWRDRHLRMTGAVVAPYRWLFSTTWLLNGGSVEDLGGDDAEPRVLAPETGVPVQVVHSSASTDFPAIRDVFVVALLSAKQRVWIQSPYFVPDEPLLTAMCTAAASGADVRFMMTGLPDKKIPFYAAHAYFDRLLGSGVRVYLYEDGFLHAKTVTVDDDVTMVGTCNWDIRSVILHDEVTTILYDRALTEQAARLFKDDLSSCREVTVETLASLGAWAGLRNSALRLSSRLL